MVLIAPANGLGGPEATREVMVGGGQVLACRWGELSHQPAVRLPVGSTGAVVPREVLSILSRCCLFTLCCPQPWAKPCLELVVHHGCGKPTGWGGEEPWGWRGT